MSINSSMKSYNFYLIGEIDEYGQAALPTVPTGKIEISINILSQNSKDNILYSEAAYIGLTKENITDKYIIDFNGTKLKVLYVNSFGRYNQVYLGSMN